MLSKISQKKISRPNATSYHHSEMVRNQNQKWKLLNKKTYLVARDRVDNINTIVKSYKNYI